MQVGAVIGYRGLIREILSELRRELGGTPTILATGGDAELIGKGISDIDIIDQDLTMKGIQVIGQTNH
jgi:type III pantothenate kinase